jgi:glycerol-3-phosphate dehydrogenase (NAD(P)+)
MQRDAAQRALSAGGRFPAGLEAVADLGAALAGARDALVAVPSHAFRATLAELEPRLDAGARIAWASKGFEIATGLLPHQVANEVLGERPGAVLSGPTFAREVGAGCPPP